MIPTFRLPRAARFRALLAAVCCLLAAALAAPAWAQGAAPGAAFARGINIGDYLAYPDGEDWPLFRGRRAEVTDAELERLAGTGLTFIRLPVEPGPFLDLPPKQVAQLERRLTAFLTRAGAAGLAVMVTGFPRHEKPPWRPEDILAEGDGSTFDRYERFLTRLAELLQAVPGTTTALELMNEPQAECAAETGTDWTVRQRELHARLRAVAPALTLVLTPGCWSGIDGLETLDMAGYDANTLVDVHYYEPFAFTHQGATWTLPELKYLGGLSFPARRTDKARAREAIARLAVARHPGAPRAQRLALSLATQKLHAYLRSDPGRGTVSRRMDRIARWAEKAGIAPERIVIGEFGALRPLPESRAGDDGSRNRWLETVTTAAKTRGFGWALWAYHGAFGLLADGEPGPLDAAMVRALGLKPPQRDAAVNQSSEQAARTPLVR